MQPTEYSNWTKSIFYRPLVWANVTCGIFIHHRQDFYTKFEGIAVVLDITRGGGSQLNFPCLSVSSEAHTLFYSTRSHHD